MSMHGKTLVFALAVLAFGACGESPTAPTAPLPNSPAEPWSGGSGVLWSHRGAPDVRDVAGGRMAVAGETAPAVEEPGVR